MRIAKHRLLAATSPLLLAIAVTCTFVTAAAGEDAKPAATEPKKATAPSPCKGLDNAACTANAECRWYKEARLKSGKTRKAHCRKKPTRSAKPKPKTTAPPT